MKKRTWLAAALAAAVWFSAGAGTVARARAYTEVWTDLFEIVSVRTNVYGPGAFTGTEADSGIYVELEAKCNLPESVPTSGTTMEDGMQVFGGLHDTDFVLCRLAVDLGGYPGGGDRESPVYLRAEDCSFIANPTVPPYCSIFEDAAGEVDPLYTGTYLRIPVSELRKTDGRFSVCWYSHHTYPSSEYGEWVTQCLLDKKSCRFYLDAALMAEPYDNMWTVLKTASPADPQARGDCEVSEAVSLAPIAVPWPRWTLEKPSLTAERNADGTLAITYTTVGNDVDTNSFPAAAGNKDFGHWVVAFVNRAPDGTRNVIPRDELRFTGQAGMEPLSRTYADWDEETYETSGTHVLTKNGGTKTDFFAPEAYALPTNPATFQMVWDNLTASGYIEAWLYFADMRPDATAARVFSDTVFQGNDSIVMPANTYELVKAQLAEASDRLQRVPIPFGEYQEAVSGYFDRQSGALDLWKGVHGKDPLVEITGLTTLVGYTKGMDGWMVPWNWRADGVTQFTTYDSDRDRADWTPAERGIHVLDLENNGVAGKMAVWFDEPRWAPLPGAEPNDPVGAKAVSLYPWTNAVAIDFALDALDPGRMAYIEGRYVTKTDGQIDQDKWQQVGGFRGEGTAKLPFWLVRAGDTPQTMYWEPASDIGSGVRKKEADLILAADWVPILQDPLQYLIVDVSGGPNAEKWPVTVRSTVPEGGWGDEYKTDKIVLRRIEAGSFTMGSPTNEPMREYYTEEQHPVRLTEAFYIGVFEITQAQWENVMGEKAPSFKDYYSDGLQPVRDLSYDDLRGTDRGQGWPGNMAVDSGTFLGRLREKAQGFAWDLPTEAQWEYACRAGTKTAYNDGSDMERYDIGGGRWVDDTLSLLGRYDGNRYDGVGGHSDDPTVVGSYKPNKWGLYDMHGNVEEWTRDWRRKWNTPYGDVQNEAGEWVDPKGVTREEADGSAVTRGGSWASHPEGCRSAWNYTDYQNTDHDNRRYFAGFRIGAFVWPFGLDWDGAQDGDGNGN